MRLGIVVPTRNRWRLACSAVSSIFDSPMGSAEVVVSDNSTDEPDVEALSSWCADQPGVRYIRPPTPMTMTDHWNWALQEIRAAADITHLTFLTDRMRWQHRSMEAVCDLVRHTPDQVISYGSDRVEDYSAPVRLVQEPWTGRALEIASRCLLEYAARGGLHPALPRMLNSVSPVEHLESLSTRFGDVFGSVSPDFCFAYRTLGTRDSIVYYDRSCLVHYALDRSNGANYARGGSSPDSLDFLTLMEGGELSYASPIPGVHSLLNATIHEYALVREELGGDRLPSIDLDAYKTAISRDLQQLEDEAQRNEGLRLLSEHGWSGFPSRRALAVKLFREKGVRGIAAAVGSRVQQAATSGLAGVMWLALAQWGIRAPGGHRLIFRSREEALSYAARFPRRPTRSRIHLHPLLCEEPRREIEID